MTPQTPYWLVVTRPARTKPRSRPKTLRPTRNTVLTTAPRAACSRRVRPPSRSARVAVDTAGRLRGPGEDSAVRIASPRGQRQAARDVAQVEPARRHHPRRELDGVVPLA